MLIQNKNAHSSSRAQIAALRRPVEQGVGQRFCAHSHGRAQCAAVRQPVEQGVGQRPARPLGQQGAARGRAAARCTDRQAASRAPT